RCRGVSRQTCGSGPRSRRTALGGDGRLQGGAVGAEGGRGDRGSGGVRSSGSARPVVGFSSSWQGGQGQQEADGGCGGGVYDQAICANGRRCDRGSDAGEGPPAPPQSPAQTSARRVVGTALSQKTHR